MIERTDYMSILKRWKDKKVIKVVTGIRRCGKSSLLRMFQKTPFKERCRQITNSRHKL